MPVKEGRLAIRVNHLPSHFKELLHYLGGRGATELLSVRVEGEGELASRVNHLPVHFNELRLYLSGRGGGLPLD